MLSMKGTHNTAIIEMDYTQIFQFARRAQLNLSLAIMPELNTSESFHINLHNATFLSLEQLTYI